MIIIKNEPAKHAGTKKAVCATVVGNMLEWFDFTVYSFFAVIIAKVFFPSDSELTSYLLALATFGVGFIMRPLGGIVIGTYSDRRGRKAALTLTIMLMAVGTFIIAITPGYSQIGMFAPILILIARLLQGFSAGGEMGSATAFLTEHAPEGRKAFYSSWMQSSIGLAVVLGAGTGAMVSSWLTQEQLEGWGWRIPFIIGCLIAPVGFYIRSRVHEPDVKREKREKTPFADVLQNYLRPATIMFFLVILWTVCTYAVLFYIPSYATRVLHLPSQEGFLAGTVGGLAIMFVTPIVGYFADRTGYRVWLMGSALGIFIAVLPMFLLINKFPGLPSLIVFELVLGLLISAYMGPILATFSDLLPPHVLSTGLSIAYNLAVTIFGGFATFTITWLIASTGSPLAPAFYIMFAAAISLVGATLYRNQYGASHFSLERRPG